MVGRTERNDRTVCAKGGKNYARDCKPVKLKRDEFMPTISQNQHSSLLQQNIPVPESTGTTLPALLRRDMKG